MKKEIDFFLEYLSTITKEESDYIESILKWDDEKRLAFMFAKKIFEQRIEDQIETKTGKIDEPR
jgi:hypothetical protein